MARMSVPRWSVYIVVAALIASLSFSFGSLYSAFGTNHDTTYYACLYAGSLTQVSETPPASCGRGSEISWNSEGVAGTPGVDGIDGVSGYEIVSGSRSILSNEGSLTSVDCPDGKVALGGGPRLALADASLSPYFHVISSYPSNDEQGVEDGERWYVWVRNTGPTTIPYSIVATCAVMAVDAP